MRTFRAYASYYDLLYTDKNYSAEVAFVVSRLKRFAPAAVRILELGCGTGVHGLGLAEAGYQVRGVDLSEEMLAVANRRRSRAAPQIAAQISFEYGDIRNLVGLGQFDAATSLFHVMSYQVEDRDLSDVLATVRQHLRAGCPFIFDFWYGPAVEASGPLARSKEVENDSYAVVRRATPLWERERNVVVVRYNVTVIEKKTGAVHEFEENHSVRYFFLPSLTDQLNSNGFRVAECGEWLTDQVPSEASFSSYILAIAE